jgi:hypothetical protein
MGVLISITKRKFGSKRKEKVLVLWKNFEKRKCEASANIRTKLNTNEIKKKNKLVYEILKKPDYFSFNQYEKTLIEEENQKLLSSALNLEL